MKLDFKHYKTGAIALALAVGLWSVTIMPKMIIAEKILEICKTETGHDKDCIKLETTKEKKIQELCDANPKIECQRFRDYCDESLSTGNECFIFNFPLYEFKN